MQVSQPSILNTISHGRSTDLAFRWNTQDSLSRWFDMVPRWGWNAKYTFQTHRHGMLKTAFSKSTSYLIHARGAAWRRKLPSFAKGRAKGRVRSKQTPARRRLSVSLTVRQMEQRTIPAFYCW